MISTFKTYSIWSISNITQKQIKKHTYAGHQNDEQQCDGCAVNHFRRRTFKLFEIEQFLNCKYLQRKTRLLFTFKKHHVVRDANEC